jgi:hypothetical protein
MDREFTKARITDQQQKIEFLGEYADFVTERLWHTLNAYKTRTTNADLAQYLREIRPLYPRLYQGTVAV